MLDLGVRIPALSDAAQALKNPSYLQKYCLVAFYVFCWNKTVCIQSVMLQYFYSYFSSHR